MLELFFLISCLFYTDADPKSSTNYKSWLLKEKFRDEQKYLVLPGCHFFFSFLLDGISTFVSYSMLKTPSEKNSCGTISLRAGE